MPTDIRRQLRFLLQNLLHLVFAEISGAGIICLLKHRHRLCLTDRDQRDILHLPSAPLAGVPYILTYFF